MEPRDTFPKWRKWSRLVETFESNGLASGCCLKSSSQLFATVESMLVVTIFSIYFSSLGCVVPRWIFCSMRNYDAFFFPVRCVSLSFFIQFPSELDFRVIFFTRMKSSNPWCSSSVSRSPLPFPFSLPSDDVTQRANGLHPRNVRRASTPNYYPCRLLGISKEIMFWRKM